MLATVLPIVSRVERRHRDEALENEVTFTNHKEIHSAAKRDAHIGPIKKVIYV